MFSSGSSREYSEPEKRSGLGQVIVRCGRVTNLLGDGNEQGEGQSVAGESSSNVRRGVSNALGDGRAGKDMGMLLGGVEGASLMGDGGVEACGWLGEGVFSSLMLMSSRVRMFGLIILSLGSGAGDSDGAALISQLLIDTSGGLSSGEAPKLKAAGLWIIVTEV